MPYDVKRFIFSVSLCAMLVANPVLATAPTNDEELGTTHDVYVESTLNQATNGIAGVSYVNRMVNAAGNAAELAEGHAAAAGAHALSAAQSADEAHKVLADKVNIDQGADNKNKVMVTNASGYVAPGYITSDMIGTAENELGRPLISWSGKAMWGQVWENGIADGAVTNNKINDRTISLEKMNYVNTYASGIVSDGIPLTTNGGTGTGLALSQISSVGIADGAVTADKIAGGAVTTNKIAPDTNGISGVLITEPAGVGWGKINNKLIGDGAVTIEKTAGVVGMVPVGSADATTYGQFWIE